MAPEKLRIVVAGSSGFVGRHLVPHLEHQGHDVRQLVRSVSQADEKNAVPWDPSCRRLEPAVCEWADVIINLCGRNIAAGRWTSDVKQDLEASRLDPTRLLSQAIGEARRPPLVLINASATGLYGNRGDEQLSEASSPGSGFLADLTQSWEAAAEAAQSASTRVVLLRFGMILGPGGALKRMAPIFRLGLGGPLGSGRQWWPWVALEDALQVIDRALEDANINGPCNVVSPTSQRCSDFSRALGRVLHRPTFLPAPAFGLRLLLGEMATDLLLSSARVTPSLLLERSHDFRYPDLESALRHALR